MVRVLTLSGDEMQHGVATMVPYDYARLERAKYNLEHRIEIFGLQEQFGDFIDQSAAQFGWDLGERETHLNRTGPSEVSEELRARIARDTPSTSSCTRLPRGLGTTWSSPIDDADRLTWS